METVFETDYTVDAVDINLYGRLRPTRLLELIQQVAGRHAALLGFGWKKLEEQRLAWVLVRQHLEIDRMPERDEIMHFVTWPGRPMHSLLPRYMQILDGSGHEIIRSCTVWVIMNEDSRSMILPSSFGINFPFSSREPLMALPRMPKVLLPELFRTNFTVPFSYVDIIGHMNNTRYMDAAENILPAPQEGAFLKDLLIEYSHELRLNETMEMTVGQDGSRFSVRGIKNGDTVFTLYLRYETA